MSRSAVLPIAVTATTILGLAFAAAFVDPSAVVFFGAYAGLGAYLAVRRPANPIGWLLMLTGWGLVIGNVPATAPLDALRAGTLTPAQAAAAWANGWGWILVFIGLTGVTLVFPSGRLPDGRGRLLSRIAIVAMVGLAIALTFGPTINITLATDGSSVDIPNPVALLPDAPWWRILPDPSALFVTLFFILVAGVIALILRFRRSVGLERLQYRWLVAALALVAIGTITWAVATHVLDFASSGPVLLPILAAYPAVPIAIVIAVQRYRLYELDRIISRTIAYAAVSAILVGVFGAGVVVLSAALSTFAQGQTIAVAGSTLLDLRGAPARPPKRAPDRRSAVRPGALRCRPDRSRFLRPTAPRDRHGGGDDGSRANDPVGGRSGVAVALVPRPRRRQVTPRDSDPVDAIVVGAGPNGLAAAITLARAGRSVRVYEAAATAGGGTRTVDLTLPGFRHDMCSTILSLATASPFFRPWTSPRAGSSSSTRTRRSPIRSTAAGRSCSSGPSRRPRDGLGGAGRAAPGRRLFGPLVRDADKLSPEILRPVVHLPRHPLALARFGLPALRSARGLARGRFRDEAARALFAGISAHAMLDLDRPLTASFGLVLGDLRPRRRLADGPRRCGRPWPTRSWPSSRRPAARSSPDRRVGRRSPSCHRRGRSCSTRGRASWSAIAGERLSPRTRRRAERFRYGSGVFKLDWALDGPVPVGGRRDAPRGDGPSRRDARRDRGGRGRGRRRPPPGPAVRAVRPVRAVGPVARAGRQDHRLGVLPRAGGLRRRHDRPDRGPGRAFRARLPRPDPGPLRPRTRPPWRPMTRTTSAATSTAGSRTSASSSSGRGRRSIRIALVRACTCARHRRHPAAGSMG